MPSEKELPEMKTRPTQKRRGSATPQDFEAGTIPSELGAIHETKRPRVAVLQGTRGLASATNRVWGDLWEFFFAVESAGSSHGLYPRSALAGQISLAEVTL